jgi:cell division protein FtsB
MPNVELHTEKKTPEIVTAPLANRALEFAQRAWRPTGTGVIVCLAMLLMGHVVNGKNGLTVWRQKRIDDRQLQKEINQLQQENAQLRQHVEQLKSDPDAIEHEAREKLHYAKPNEVIVTLPPQPKDQSQPAASGK